MEFREGTQRVGLALMFTDIVGSTGLVAELGDDAWSTVLSWHDDVLREQFHAHGGREVRQLGDGFFTVCQDPYPAVACAVKIQRRLAHQSGGVGLSVRIGVHRSEVVQRGSDYLGRGVHEAARMAAIAGGGEIVVSVPTLTAATVRGLPERVDIVRIAASRSRRRGRPGDLPRRDPLHAVSPVRPAEHVATA